MLQATLMLVFISTSAIWYGFRGVSRGFLYSLFLPDL